MLHSAAEPLGNLHDLVMLDLDGVVYVGGKAVRGAPEALAAARSSGLHLAFITNNASRTPEAVAAHLTDLGIDAAAGDVVTSAQAAARLLVDRFGIGCRVLLLGGAGLAAALRAEDLVPVRSLKDDAVVAVASGYGPDVLWRDIMSAAVHIRGGLPWVASNGDLTIPTADGPAPGHGVLVRMLEQFTGVTPSIAGKPEQPLFDETLRRVGGSRPLMVGDRLDTDIEGARRAGIDSLLVLTGVTGLLELAAATAEVRPTYVSTGLSGLLATHPVPQPEGVAHVLAGWSGEVLDGRLTVRGEGDADDWWRVAVTAAWSWLDSTGAAADVSDAHPPDAPGVGAGR